MTRQRHYHPLAALRFLRKAVVVCLLPLANALLEFSLNALLTALRQDAALLLFLCGASSILLEASSWALDEAGVLRLRWAFISKRERIIRGEALGRTDHRAAAFLSAARGQPGGALPGGPACQASRHPLFAQRRRTGAC